MENENNKDVMEQIERQIERASLFAHTSLSRYAAHINEVESFMYAVIDILTKRGITPPEELKIAVENIRKEMVEKNEMVNTGLAIRVDNENDDEFIPVNCEDRMHICHAVCCKLNFALSVKEIESGKIRWDLGRPYTIRQEKSCYCTHINSENKHCNIYEHRPSVCKKYSCAKDERIWKDFEKMELNKEWINENIQESTPHFIKAPMFTNQQTENTYYPEPSEDSEERK
jgi:Fe-S-cluster containining protein